MWDRFSTTEMERRLRLARDLMREREFVALLVFGNSGVNRHNHANVFWLTNHLDLHHAYLRDVVTRAAEQAVGPGVRSGIDLTDIEPPKK